MKTLTLITLLGSFFTSSLIAEEKSPAGQLVDLIQGSELSSSMQGMITPMLDNFKQQGMTDQGIKELQLAFQEFVKLILNDPELRSKTIDLYQKHYTEDEIQGLLDFYNTPLGAKFIETLPAITTESVTLGQTVAMKHQASFQKELERIIGEHMGAEAAPPKKAIEKE